ncbi:hypothetical protein [Varunaivibrio sulfuroxidans]|uniref:Uncharacterized protein n=1 Tax=Varunaivibrio sulfuroxidans TaxID=1773489 RepID=A0A4R3JFW2_9PROT|nr:hypothetical protein [Varunaivibrio sulfuroxidans]TCS63580.1 hypothetical protein EDD55_103203 [Varunaivibrio sulfuroxidans]WES30277.1 hypothetical protein P3M64_11630 [Varunaivibrio sulfuroxidans]
MTTTEIYICREGQALEDGQVEYSDRIISREDAESDAFIRCSAHGWIKKIAYYKVNDAGDFRIFYAYTNPNVLPEGRPQASKNAVGKSARVNKKKIKQKNTLWRKLAFWSRARRR